MKKLPLLKTSSLRQRGAVTIEFSVLFLIFFIVLYGIIAYSLPLLLKLSFQQTSVDAGRMIYRVDTGQSQEKYIEVLAREVNQVVDNSWLPRSWRQGNCDEPATDILYHWHPLPAADHGVSYGHFALDLSIPDDPRYLLHTCIQRGYNKAGKAEERAIIPIMGIGGFHIPALPENAQGKVVIKGETITRL